ncbi:MAG: hypothetical protein R3Y64_11010 [Peptostreptococcaceae bacterium]
MFTEYKNGDMIIYETCSEEIRGKVVRVKSDTELEIEVAYFYNKSDTIIRETLFVKKKTVRPITQKEKIMTI